MLKEADEILSAGLVGFPQLKGLLSLFQMA